MEPEARPVPPEFAQALRELGLAAADEVLAGAALTGGVSSDIWRIQTRRGSVCAKRALGRLRVAADWRAPIERNQYEARWMRVAQAAVPGAAPRVLGQHAALGVLVMEYLPPGAHALWKEQLRRGLAEPATAAAVGRTLVRIHAHSAARAAELAPQFDTDRIFFDIRLEPYLVATAKRHPDLAPALQALVAQTQGHPLALVHGDVSPKNILVATGAGADARPVLLDAECAWWGDPAFDLAFCLNHLLLKGLWLPPALTTLTALEACFAALAAAYLEGVDWEPRAAIEQRAAALLPGLLLARVDGKSPVEYLDQLAQHETVRRVARALLAQPVPTLAEVSRAWQQDLRDGAHSPAQPPEPDDPPA
ncbi:MAG: phosphotransferase [Burkholderiales bacterium]|nr:phosphotransferase [Burkholderiales bacterium]